MERLNFNHLFYFYVVAKEGSIKEASEKVFITQSTISDQLKLLEEYFGCKLFDRRSRGLYLNNNGEIALTFAEKIFGLGNELTYNLRNQLDVPKKSLDIGVTHRMSQYFLYDRILPLFDQNEVSINIKEGDRRHLLADLEEGKIDLVFTDSKEGLSPTTSSYKIGVNRTFVMAHKKFNKLKKNFPESLEEIPFFNYTSENSLKYEIELFFSRHNIAPQVIGEADDIDLLSLVTEKGLAFTVIPEAAKNRFSNLKDVVILGEVEELETTVWGIVKNSYKGLGYQLLKKKL